MGQNYENLLKENELLKQKIKHYENKIVEESSEDLLSEDKKRFVIFPIKYDKIWEMYKKAEANFWTAEELDLSKDYKDFSIKMNDKERFFIENVLAFFAASDGIVNENLGERFFREIQILKSIINLPYLSF